MWVKICGNTNVEDALEAAALGANAVGFVFAPSVRQVSPQTVRAVSAKLPASVERVGVFANASIDHIASIAEEAALTTVQLHADFDLSFALRLRARLGEKLSVIQTMHWNVGHPEDSGPKIIEQLAALAESGEDDRVLIDAKVGKASGGLGVSFEWMDASNVLRGQPKVRVIVAGGLDPANVANAIHQLQPWGVDVASGVERRPGFKDFQKLRAFIENARGTNR